MFVPLVYRKIHTPGYLMQTFVIAIIEGETYKINLYSEILQGL